MSQKKKKKKNCPLSRAGITPGWPTEGPWFEPYIQPPFFCYYYSWTPKLRGIRHENSLSNLRPAQFFFTLSFPSLVHSTRPNLPDSSPLLWFSSLVEIQCQNYKLPPHLPSIIVSLEITIMMFILQRCSYDVSIMMLFPSYECG